MRPGLEGRWIVELNTTELPKVLVNNTYYAQISGKMRNKNDKKYITDKLQWANWLVKSLHQRATTILKVASEIVSQQESFFELGVEHLKPLALRDIAEEIEMHESTVSRVPQTSTSIHHAEFSNLSIFSPLPLAHLKAAIIIRQKR